MHGERKIIEIGNTKTEEIITVIGGVDSDPQTWGLMNIFIWCDASNFN
jgi:hypothetical protein